MTEHATTTGGPRQPPAASAASPISFSRMILTALLFKVGFKLFLDQYEVSSVALLGSTSKMEDRFHAPTTQQPQQQRFETRNLTLEELWIGHGRSSTIMVDPHDIPLTVVVTFCHGSIDWIESFLTGYNVQSIAIVSKCGISPASKLPPLATLVESANVGACDHTMADWMANFSNKESVADADSATSTPSMVLFLKDNRHIHQPFQRERELSELLTIASSSIGFACGLEPTNGMSIYHQISVLNGFELGRYGRDGGSADADNVPFKSQYPNLGGWYEGLNLLSSLPFSSPYTAVCYGGEYAVQTARVAAVPGEVWKRIEQSLLRGNNIEESHFAERSWAALLSEPLNQTEVELIQSSKFHLSDLLGYSGTLVKG